MVKTVTLKELSTEKQSEWIDRLWNRLWAYYGARFSDMWAGQSLDDIKAVWRDELSRFGTDEIARAVEACKVLKFPPTLPEFIGLCRPSTDSETAYNEARRNLELRDQEKPMKWSSKAVYWSYVQFGAYDLRNENYIKSKRRWDQIYSEMLSEQSLPDIPIQEHRALPEPGKQSISWEEASKRLQEVKKKTGMDLTAKKANRDWARKILANPSQYPDISVKFAKEALGIEETA